MKWLVLIGAAALLSACTSVDVLGAREQTSEVREPPGPSEPGGTGGLRNVLEERQRIPISQVNARLNDAFLQLFFGDPETEAVFFDQGDGTAYIQDIANGDVRTDSMAYGMLVTVQLDHREVFDKLWGWAKQHMLSSSGSSAGLLRWRCDTSGESCASTAATDASSIIATTLLMAETRWGAAGTHDYERDALALLDAMVAIEERNGGVVDGVVNCFDGEAALPRLSSRSPEQETAVDYLMPAFYEVWSRHDQERSALWKRAAENARELLSQVAHPETGLLPEIVSHSGEPDPERDDYRTTTARTLLNLTLDHLWFGPFDWVVEQNERRLDFFLEQGLDDYVSEYTIAGEALVPFNTAAHRSLVALAAGTSKSSEHDVFLEVLLDEPVPAGSFRYYDGMLYMLSLLVLSGQMTPG